jgi:hypothetical protein
MPARARDARGRFVKTAAKKVKRRKPGPKVPSSVPSKKVATPAKGKKRSWNTALKLWNKNQDEWTIPKKGTPEYREVRALMG